MTFFLWLQHYEVSAKMSASINIIFLWSKYTWRFANLRFHSAWVKGISKFICVNLLHLFWRLWFLVIYVSNIVSPNKMPPTRKGRPPSSKNKKRRKKNVVKDNIKYICNVCYRKFPTGKALLSHRRCQKGIYSIGVLDAVGTKVSKVYNLTYLSFAYGHNLQTKYLIGACKQMSEQ